MDRNDHGKIDSATDKVVEAIDNQTKAINDQTEAIVTAILEAGAELQIAQRSDHPVPTDEDRLTENLKRAKGIIAAVGVFRVRD